MRYNFTTKNELLSNPDKVHSLSRIELQSWGTWLRNNGYEMCKLNAPSIIIANAVYDAFVLMAKLQAEVATAKAAKLESVQNQEPVTVTPAKPAKRDYPIRIDLNLTQSWVNWSQYMTGTFASVLNDYFSREHEQQPTVHFLWSKAV